MRRAQHPAGDLNGVANSTSLSSDFLKQAEEIAEYISQTYFYARKVIELGIGFSPWVAIKLRQLLPETEIYVVDKNPAALRELKDPTLKPIEDDLFRPKIENYLGADLLYSIHPPLELLDPMKALAEKLRAPLLVKPLSEDAYLYGFHYWKRVRLSTCVLFLWNTMKDRD